MYTKENFEKAFKRVVATPNEETFEFTDKTVSQLKEAEYFKKAVYMFGSLPLFIALTGMFLLGLEVQKALTDIKEEELLLECKK